VSLGLPISRRELGLVVLAAGLLAVGMHWPVPVNLGSEVSGDLGDPLFQSWQIAWGGHALIHQSLDYFQANIYWPLRNSLAFSDALVGYAPAGLIGSGPVAAVVRYNLVFLFAYMLAFVGPYLLARELGVGPIGGAVAGAAFAYAPWRLDQVGHLHVLSSGGIALSLFLLLRGYRGRRSGSVLAGWLVAAWQVALGFTLGLQLLYLLGVLALAAAVGWLKRRPGLGRGPWVATAAGITVLALVTFFASRPYLQVLDDHPEARRTEAMIAAYSPELRSFLAAPASDLVWGSPTARFRAALILHNEKTLFPGLVAVALAVVGVFSSAYSRRLRVGLVAGGILCAALSLGISTGRLPVDAYRLLYDHAPGWEGVRTPGRINTLTSLALALLAAAGAEGLVARLRRRWEPSLGRAATLKWAAGVVLVGAILAEGAGFDIRRSGDVSSPPHASVPNEPRGQRSAPAPQVHLPFMDHRYVLWSTDGFPTIVNGVGAFDPSLTRRIRVRTRTFPDKGSVAWLRTLGVRTVVLHPALAPGTQWQSTARKSVRGLALRRERRGGVVLYHLRPGEPRSGGEPADNRAALAVRHGRDRVDELGPEGHQQARYGIQR
jgi:hypothetical protein